MMSRGYLVKSVPFVMLVVFLLKNIVLWTRKDRTSTLLTLETPALLVKKPFCSPIKRILFLKTHKTGGSTITNILYRHADTRNLTMVLPRKQVFSFFWPLDFQMEYMEDLHGHKPDVLCNHARYKHEVMRTLFPTGTPFITILRDPLTRFESSFFFEDFPAFLGIKGVPNPYQYFVERLMKDKRTEKMYTLRNGMSFDLGLNPKDFNHTNAVQAFIKKTARNFDLVLIMEHFDESLALMRRKLCWRLEDMVYVKHNCRLPMSKRFHIHDTLRKKVLEWNSADVMLYKQFNKTLWKQIKLQDESFGEEVKALKEASLVARKTCLSSSVQVDPFVKAVRKLMLKENVSHQMMGLCKRLIKKEDTYLQYFRSRQRTLI